ncbi:MAG: fused MFS/spermidine synthase, partial [Myxococcota bacterium]
FGGSGFTAIGYEVLWFRMLRYFAAHTVYTFSTFLAVYLVGLVIGAAVCARWTAARADPVASFARVQLAIAATALVSFTVLGRSRLVLTMFAAYTPITGGSLPGLIALAAVVLLPPTIVLGLAFPLASEVAVGSLDRVGSRIGLLYGANTLGGVLGSLVTGFWLLPVLGAEGAFVALIAANLALFAVVVGAAPHLRTRTMAAEGGLAVATIVAGLVVVGPDHLRDAQTAFTGEAVAFEETADAAFLVMQYDELHTGKYQQLIVNGTSYANNRPPFRRYMATLGHLPTLLHRDPRSAVVICVGTGTTVGSVSLYPELDPVYAVDLTRTVFELAPWFEPINQRFLASPRVRPVVADGRHFLLVTDQTFDVLTFEPPPPQQAGVVNLYSREFYALAAARLADDGVLAQWIPLHEGYEDLQKTLIRTLFDTFPHVSLWMPDGYEGVAIASRRPLSIDPDRLRARMVGPVGDDLRAVGFDAPEDLLGTFVAADDALLAWLGDVPVLTDDQPVIEYFFGYDNVRFRNAHLDPRPIEPWLSAPADPVALDRARTQTRALWASEDAVVDGRYPDAGRAITEALATEPSDRYLRYAAAQIRLWADAAAPPRDAAP